MFNPKAKTTEDSHSGTTSIISIDTIIRGDLESNGDMRIDGKLIGNIICKAKLLIGPQGIVEGNINGNNADIHGKVNGNIKLNGQLNLIGKSVITGDIHVGKLQIESTVCFNGKCHMGANVVELNNEQATAINE
jgi:cytoskeletal protein CcmA (bactofilin family)